jgi:hypothetical protein
MLTDATTIFEVELDDPADEEAFVRWWEAAARLARDRARATGAWLHVLGRGRYHAVLGFALPGAWPLLARDRAWRELDHTTRPPGRMTVQAARVWHGDGNPRTISTAELARWVEERNAGARDFLLVDTLPATMYEEHHLPGAVNVPYAELKAHGAEPFYGPDKDRTIVVYCTGYG